MLTIWRWCICGRTMGTSLMLNGPQGVWQALVLSRQCQELPAVVLTDAYSAARGPCTSEPHRCLWLEQPRGGPDARFWHIVCVTNVEYAFYHNLSVQGPDDFDDINAGDDDITHCRWPERHGLAPEPWAWWGSVPSYTWHPRTHHEVSARALEYFLWWWIPREDFPPLHIDLHRRL